jgi:hypothetical protein
MNKHMIFYSIIISGMCTQPLSAMLALRRSMPRQVFTKIKPTSVILNTRHMATRVSKTKLMPLLPQAQTETLPQTITQQNSIDLFADYPYLKHLPHDSLLHKNCETLLAKVSIREELSKSYADLTHNYRAYESEDILNTAHNIADNELKNNMLELKKKIEGLDHRFHQISYCCGDIESLTNLNNGLKNAYDKGIPIFSSRKEVLQYIITNPQDTSLVNCYKHYPLETAIITSNTIFFSIMLACGLPITEAFLSTFMMNLWPIPLVSAAFAEESSPYRYSVNQLLGNAEDTVQQAEFEHYKNVASSLRLKIKESNKTPKTLGQKIDELISKSKAPSQKIDVLIKTLNDYRSKLRR